MRSARWVHSCRRWVRTRVPRRVWATLLLAVALLGAGTVGYPLIEGPEWSHFDGFYMTAITLTTIGYGEVHPLSHHGRLFTVVLAYGGIFTLAYFASELVRAVVSGELGDLIGRQRVDDKLSTLDGHLIVCGHGRMGRIVCAELDRQRKAFVLVDKDGPRLEGFPYKCGLPVHGDGTADEVLRKAGVERARALITVVPSDAANLYITLSARQLAPKLVIVARAEEEGAEVKLRRVGANQVISPYLSGGHRAVQAVLRPGVLQFLEMATRPEFHDLQIEEVRVRPGSGLAGRTLHQSAIGRDLGVVVLGVIRPGGELVYYPQGDAVIVADAVLIALGKRQQLDVVETMASAPKG